MFLLQVEPCIRFERMTYRLQGDCSATELTRLGANDENRTHTVCLEGRSTTIMQHSQCISNGIRIRVIAVKGRCPRPLDDGDLVQQVGLEPTITEL